MSGNTKPLDALAERINAGHRAYLATARKALDHALDVGAALQEAKEGLPHGEWLPWLQSNCPAISERSAQRYIRLAKNRGTIKDKSDTVADLTVRAAEKSITEPKLIPPDGHALIARWEGGGEALVWPSADHPGYFFLNVCIPVDDGFWVEGQIRPVRGDFVEEVFGRTFRYFMPASAKWEPVPVTPIKYNLYFWPYDPLSSPGTCS
ncbi:MAG: DUF3102 domain-containing protein [Alphaproteobacteria bacterium]|nr:DUF3102 domain-containing protein [Alphaproteobacteria bacterium]